MLLLILHLFHLSPIEYEHLTFLWGRGIDKVIFPGVLGLLAEHAESWSDATSTPAQNSLTQIPASIASFMTSSNGSSSMSLDDGSCIAHGYTGNATTPVATAAATAAAVAESATSSIRSVPWISQSEIDFIMELGQPREGPLSSVEITPIVAAAAADAAAADTSYDSGSPVGGGSSSDIDVGGGNDPRRVVCENGMVVS